MKPRVLANHTIKLLHIIPVHHFLQDVFHDAFYQFLVDEGSINLNQPKGLKNLWELKKYYERSYNTHTFPFPT
jgi:hypothetical protein